MHTIITGGWHYRVGSGRFLGLFLGWFLGATLLGEFLGRLLWQGILGDSAVVAAVRALVDCKSRWRPAWRTSQLFLCHGRLTTLKNKKKNCHVHNLCLQITYLDIMSHQALAILCDVQLLLY